MGGWASLILARALLTTIAILPWTISCGTTTGGGPIAVPFNNGVCGAGLVCVGGYCQSAAAPDAGATDTANAAPFLSACLSAKCASQIGLCTGGCQTWMTCASKCAASDSTCQQNCAKAAANDTAAVAGIQSVLQCIGANSAVCDGLSDATSQPDSGSGAEVQGSTDSGTNIGTDSGPKAKTFKAIVIWDKSEDPGYIDGKCGSSPGSDIDAVMLYRNGKLIGAGKVGTTNYSASASSSCDNKKNIAASAEGPVNGHVYASSPDTGYISLNGGSIELQFGACSTATQDATKCDGKGALIDVEPGDQIDIYEVDASYKPGTGTIVEGFAYAGCVCYSDEYQVDLRVDKGVDAGSVALPSSAKGLIFKGTEAYPVNKKTATVP